MYKRKTDGTNASICLGIEVKHLYYQFSAVGVAGTPDLWPAAPPPISVYVYIHIYIRINVTLKILQLLAPRWAP